MPRPLWKGPWCDPRLVMRVRELIAAGGPKEQKVPLRVYQRNSMITPPFVGFKVEIHNGKEFKQVEIKEQMLGHRFGEFSITHKRPVHPEKSTASLVPQKPATKP